MMQLLSQNFITEQTFLFSKFLTFFSIAVKHILTGVSLSDDAIFPQLERDVFTFCSQLPVIDVISHRYHIYQ